MSPLLLLTALVDQSSSCSYPNHIKKKQQFKQLASLVTIACCLLLFCHTDHQPEEARPAAARQAKPAVAAKPQQQSTANHAPPPVPPAPSAKTLANAARHNDEPPARPKLPNFVVGLEEHAAAILSRGSAGRLAGSVQAAPAPPPPPPPPSKSESSRPALCSQMADKKHVHLLKASILCKDNVLLSSSLPSFFFAPFGQGVS